MSRKSGFIISDAARRLAATDAGGDWHDVPRHHRYYGSSAFNGGERIVERRGGLRRAPPRPAASDRDDHRILPAALPP